MFGPRKKVSDETKEMLYSRRTALPKQERCEIYNDKSNAPY